MYKKLKKQKGERFAQTIRNFHNGILEIPDLDVIVRHAGREAEPLLPYLMSLLASNDDTPQKAPANPFDLLEQAGYDAFYADTLEKQNSIKGYFAKGELLCTFNDKARHKNFHIVHAVKKDVDKIKREDFKGKEEREDAYGTSVISIQMLKTGGFISIKNRYNHTVDGCDNTFKSNPDNIIEGLSQSLKDHFNVDFKANDTLPGEYHAVGRQVFKYHAENNGIYYGDQAWIKNGKIYEVNRSAGDALFEGCLFDNKTKTLKKIDPDSPDSFADTFNRYYGGNLGLIVDKKGNLTLDGEVLIGAEDSRIKTLSLSELKEMDDFCLPYANNLTQINLPVLEKMGATSFMYVKNLTQISAPKLQSIENECFSFAYNLTKIDMPKLRLMGDSCFRVVNDLMKVDMSALKSMGNKCFHMTSSLTNIALPNLQKMGEGCFFGSISLKQIEMPLLKKMGDSCFQYTNLTSIKMPLLQSIDQDCFRSVSHLTDIEMPLLQSMGPSCFENAPDTAQEKIFKIVKNNIQKWKKHAGYPSF